VISTTQANQNASWLSPCYIAVFGAATLQALTESRQQAEHQQLAEIKGRSFLQGLKADLVANP